MKRISVKQPIAVGSEEAYAESSGRHADQLPKDVREVALIGKARVECDLGKGIAADGSRTLYAGKRRCAGACLSQAAAILEGQGKRLRSKIEREMRKAA